MTTTDESVYWELREELQFNDPRVEEGTVMGGRCGRVAGEFLALVEFKASGLEVQLPKERVQQLIDDALLIADDPSRSTTHKSRIRHGPPRLQDPAAAPVPDGLAA